jgi:hypothetical protein
VSTGVPIDLKQHRENKWIAKGDEMDAAADTAEQGRKSTHG